MAVTPIVAIVGRANVGKSTLFNRLVGSRQAITHEKAGTTRDPVHGLAEWGKHRFWLVDTAGLKAPEDDFESRIQDQISQAAGAADAIVLVLDSGTIITSEDRQAAKLALKTGKPVIVALNKADTTREPADNFVRLGVSQMVRTSAIHGQGTGDLMDQITSLIKPNAKLVAADLTIAIIGRPNVGKSSLLNALGRKQQAIISEIAGTTRDIGRINLKYKGQSIDILDTAGLRRSGKIEAGVEKFSTLRTMSAISQSDVCIVVMDADEPGVAGDQHIAGLVDEAGKGLILAINKWDQIEKDAKTADQVGRYITKQFQFVWWAPLLLTSAVTGQNVVKLFELAAAIKTRRQTKITTSKLNRVIESLTLKHPPAGLKNRQPKINYATQTATEPPTFALFASYPALIHFSYKRYLENGLRAEFDFTGTPIELEFRNKRIDR